MARLAAYVYLTDPDDGSTVGFGPDDEVPAWAVEQVSNPDAWAEPPAGIEQDAGEITAEPGPEPASVVVDPVSDDATPNEGGPAAAPAAVEPPPKGGPGSGREAWAAYAVALGFEVDDEMTRDDIIDAVEAP
jgi:hypothetical protein